MKYFIDTEFIEGFHKPLFGKRRHFIDLISIGIVCEDGREYYAISNEFDPKDADQWVKDNVIAKLPPKKSIAIDGGILYRNNTMIANDIQGFVYGGGFIESNPPEFYAYYADYDWVLFCSLFGRMIDLPTGFSMYCRDLKQILDDKVKDLSISSKELKAYENYPKQENEHSALDDAKWNYKLYNFLNSDLLQK
jgi:hypothetical protein